MTIVASDNRVDMQPVIQLPALMLVHYPFSMSRAGINGIVRAKLHVEPDGRIGNCSVIHDTLREFREAVLSSVSHLRFFPAKLDGQAVSADIDCEFLFDLDDD